MAAPKVTIDVLKELEPVRHLSEAHLREMATHCTREVIARNTDPFHGALASSQVAYLIRGELALFYGDGVSRVLVGGSQEAKQPIGRRNDALNSARAVTDIELVRVDDNLLDILATWDQLTERQARADAMPSNPPSMADWSIVSGMFSVNSLKSGAFSKLPAANIEALLRRFSRIALRAGDRVIREGDEGDFYYVIESGRCRVERLVGGVTMFLAELKSGDAFGEESLVSHARRNASVTMIIDGTLLRLGKEDFQELLKEPLLHRLSMPEATLKVAAGGRWVDVRYPSEYQYDKLPGAINIPLAEIRGAYHLLDARREYVVYCQSERRSSAGAFLLAQRGYKAFLLRGGLWASAERRG